MATVQDYRQARRIGQISLTDLIARNIAEGGGFGSVGKAISQKFAARKTRIKEAFDPLNIASMMVGRTKLGTAILGRMMGRSAEDIQYFARKGAGREATYDPFFSRVGAGSLQPVKQNEGMADAFAKLYNLIKKNIDDETRRKEIEKNFREEQALEDERRFNELLAAITGKAKPTATPVEKKEGGGLLDFIKGLLAGFKDMVNKVKDGLFWLYETLSPVVKMLGSGLLKIFEAMLAAGKTLLQFLASPAGFVTAIAVAQIAASLKATSDVEQKIEKAAAEGDIGTVTTEVMKRPAAQSALGAEFQDPMKFSEARAETRKELEAAASKGSPQAQTALKEFDKQELTSKYAEDYLRKKGYEVDEGGVYLATKKDTGVLGFGKEKVSKQLAEEALSYGRKRAESEGKVSPAPKTPKSPTTPASSTPTPAASSASKPAPPVASPVSSAPSMPPVVSATDQNMNLQGEYMTADTPPIIFNKAATTGVSLPDNEMGTVTGAASIRDDALENIMANLRKRSTVM
jgi:hypothetical protein